MGVLGIDIGAVTVDVAYSDGTNIKADKFTRGPGLTADEIVAAIRHLARKWAFDPAGLSEIRIGSTGAINMLLGRNFARVGLITTEGFADTLPLARQNRAGLYHPVARSPAPTFLVAPQTIHEVDGRLDPTGAQVTPLSTGRIRAATAHLVEQGVEAIAVCLLFSHLNPRHESQCAEVIAEVAPDVPVILSHEVDGNAREYERTLSACLEAALSPAQRSNVEDIAAALAGLGFAGRLSFGESRGHLISKAEALKTTSRQLASGPAASALFSGALAAQAWADQAIALDIGSTSTDVALIKNGAPSLTHHSVMAGVPTRLESADIHSVAIGGGSRAIWDKARGLEIGAEADEDAPTLTDALVSLGALPGSLVRDGQRRLGGLAERAGMTVADLALGIRDAALDRIVASVVRYAVDRNVDPAAVPLILGGGLGGTLACLLAERTGGSRVIVDRRSPMSGAVGLLMGRHATEAAAPINTPLDQLTQTDLDRALTALRSSSPADDDKAARGSEQVALRVAMATNGFMHPVTLTLETQTPTVETLRDAFAADHTARFGRPSREAGFVFGIGAIRFEARTGNGLTLAGGHLRDMHLPAGWQAVDQGGITAFVRSSAEARTARPETLQMRLNAIAQSMQELLFRTAVSPVVREGNDAAAAILTPEGELLALSDAIPLLLGALDGSARAIISRFPVNTMRDGDLFLMNDPFQGGTHLPDLTVVRPIFADGTVIALAASILHHQDMGGMRAGSVPPDAVDIYQEGLRLGPLRLGQGDRIDPTIEDLINSNSRAANTVLGDLASQVGAATRAATLLSRLATEVGLEQFRTGAQSCLDRGEELARHAISQMAPGPHDATEQLDPSPGLPEVRIKLRLNCAEERFVADFTGTSAQVAAPINCVRSGPFAAAFYSLLSTLGDTVFRNGGVVRRITLILPEASAINASPPAAVNARMGIVRSTTSALLQGLALALPGTMPAANSGMSFVLAFSGKTETDQRFIATEIIAGGAGGGPAGDGVAGISTDVGNAMNMPVEALESQIPVRVIRARRRKGSGGAGQFRGGDGIERRYLALQDGINVSLRGDRFCHVPTGVRGGGSPKPAAARVVRRDGSIETLGSRSAPVLNQGDELIVESCGGAGYGFLPSEQ